MYKFFDYLAPDLPIRTIRDLLGYIRRFAALFGAGGVPVEGQMDGVGFCATQQPGGDVRVHWVQVNRQRIPVDAVVCEQGRTESSAPMRCLLYVHPTAFFV